MTNNDYGIFTTIAQMTENELLKMMQMFLQKTYGKKKISSTQSYIIAEGKIPICLVAHMDTVFPSPPNEIYFDQKKHVVWSPQGLGADDRAGIFAIMKIIQDGFRPHIILTTGEEIGGVGADFLTKVFPSAPFHIKYMIQLDRQGVSDCVFYNCANKDFEKYINDFGFITNFGSFSDISVFCPQWKVAGVNLSIGYIREHSVSEILYTKGTYSTIERVKRMLTDADNIEQFEYVADPMAYYDMFNYGYPYSFGPTDDEPDLRMSHKLKCWKCKQEYEENDLIPVMSSQNPLYDHFYCYNCISEPNITWCRKCGDAFEKRNEKEELCQLCNKYR